MDDVLLIINSGSSSIKFSIFSYQKKLTLLYHSQIEDIFNSPSFIVLDANQVQILKEKIMTRGTEAGLNTFFNWFKNLSSSMNLKAVGHRIVHGGTYFSHPTLVTDKVIKKLMTLIPFAPFHLPESLNAIKNIKAMYTEIPQLLCFDTTFHQTQDKLAELFAIPRKLSNEGIIRYGFHGISYEYIASVITNHIGDIGNQRVIVAHLGSGASMCAMRHRKSVATSMGLSALDGLMMGTRCGAIDPGVLLYLLQEKKYSIEQVATLLYQESGLLGVSGISSDIRQLESSTLPYAVEAVELFCYIAAKELGALCAQLGGCDAIIFTAGIGEHSAVVRKKICDRLKWLGVVLNGEANENNDLVISQKKSNITVAIIPTNEEYLIAKKIIDFPL